MSYIQMVHYNLCVQSYNFTNLGFFRLSRFLFVLWRFSGSRDLYFVVVVRLLYLQVEEFRTVRLFQNISKSISYDRTGSKLMHNSEKKISKIKRSYCKFLINFYSTKILMYKIIKQIKMKSFWGKNKNI